MDKIEGMVGKNVVKISQRSPTDFGKQKFDRGLDPSELWMQLKL